MVGVKQIVNWFLQGLSERMLLMVVKTYASSKCSWLPSEWIRIFAYMHFMGGSEFDMMEWIYSLLEIGNSIKTPKENCPRSVCACYENVVKKSRVRQFSGSKDHNQGQTWFGKWNVMFVKSYGFQKATLKKDYHGERRLGSFGL